MVVGETPQRIEERRAKASKESIRSGKSITYIKSKRKELSIGLREKSDEKITLIRAQGGCQGTIRRRRTWPAAKSHGELQASIDPWISEWGNPAGVMSRHCYMNT